VDHAALENRSPPASSRLERKSISAGRESTDCEATAEELGPHCFALPGDVSTVTGISALAESFRALLGHFQNPRESRFPDSVDHGLVPISTVAARASAWPEN